MSQECVIKVKLKNLDMIKEAVKEIGWTFIEGASYVRYYEGFGQMCDHTIEFDGELKYLAATYNIGLKLAEDGTWHIVCDNSMAGPVINNPNETGGMTPEIISKLKGFYGIQAVRQLAVKKRGKVRDMGSVEYKGRRKRLLKIDV